MVFWPFFQGSQDPRIRRRQINFSESIYATKRRNSLEGDLENIQRSPKVPQQQRRSKTVFPTKTIKSTRKFDTNWFSKQQKRAKEIKLACGVNDLANCWLTCSHPIVHLQMVGYTVHPSKWNRWRTTAGSGSSCLIQSQIRLYIPRSRLLVPNCGI